MGVNQDFLILKILGIMSKEEFLMHMGDFYTLNILMEVNLKQTLQFLQFLKEMDKILVIILNRLILDL